MALSQTHRDIASMTRRFADEAIRPVAADLDRDERFPDEIYRAMAGLGLFGITVPEAHGGAGLDALAYSVVMEELSRGYASIADQCGLYELVSTLLVQHGTPEQRARWLRPLLGFAVRPAYCITEAEAGTDVSGLRTSAVRTANGWRLSGSKLWIHNAPVADLAFVLARTDKAGWPAWHEHLPGRARPARGDARPEGAQDGPARQPGRRAAVRRCRAAAGGVARRRGTRLPDHDERSTRAASASRHSRSASPRPGSRRRSTMLGPGASSASRSRRSRACNG